MRDLLFVCSAIKNGELISQIISAVSEQEAAEKFFSQNKVISIKTYGPFKNKKINKENKISIKFSNKSVKAIYNNFQVNAWLLDEPKDHAYLIFEKSLDNKEIPKDTKIVPINNLRFIDVK